MDPCKTRHPRIINNSLIEKVIERQLPPGEAGRLALIEQKSFENVEYIRLEFLNILRIDHLWMLKNLKKLVLDNNYIAKIENLESLVHLTELDLSFNKISVIENLSELINLEKLSLFDNQIETIENMDRLKKLTIFSIGRNLITDLSNVQYLRRFDNLKSLNLAENPCAKEDNFELFIACFLPQLEYYEYKLIQILQRELGAEIFQKEYEILITKEQEQLGITLAKENEEQEAQLNAKSFVEYLNTRHLFLSFFEEDADGNALLLMGEEAEDHYLVFEENIVAECKNIFNLGQAEYFIRHEEITMYENGVNRLDKEIQSEGIALTEDFFQIEELMFSNIKAFQHEVFDDKSTLDEYSNFTRELTKEYDELLHSTWKKLMQLELKMLQLIAEANELYQLTITDMINGFIETAQGLFSHMRDHENTFSDNLRETADGYFMMKMLAESKAHAKKDAKEAEEERIRRELAGEAPPEESHREPPEEAQVADREASKDPVQDAAQNEDPESAQIPDVTLDPAPITVEKKFSEKYMDDDDDTEEVFIVPEPLQLIMKDRECLSNALGASHDLHLLLIDQREDTLISRARTWLDTLISDMQTKELSRNRDKIMEINHFIEKERETFMSLVSEIYRSSQLDIG